MQVPLRLLIVALVLTGSSASHAGRTRFGWLYDTETIPERTVELETWILEEDQKGDSDNPTKSETLLWWGPVIGVTDRLELAIPIEVAYNEVGGAGETAIERFGAELRWRLAEPDPEAAPAFVPLLRLGVKRVVNARDTVRIEPGVVLAYDAGSVHLVADLGGKLEIDGDGNRAFEARPGLGVSVSAVGELRLGAEVYAELDVSDQGSVSWIAVGPNLSWTHAFHFQVNAAGVLSDGTRFDDTELSLEWDGHWDAQTTVEPDGWSAEIRIPFAVLRYDQAPAQTWGMQVRRYISARRETDEWSYIPRDAAGEVSRYGRLGPFEQLG